MVPAVTVLIVTQVYPLLYSAYFSLFDWTLARSPQPGAFIWFQNYSRAFNDHVFMQAVATTTVFAVSATVFELLIGFLLAYLTVGERSFGAGQPDDSFDAHGHRTGGGWHHVADDV